MKDLMATGQTITSVELAELIGSSHGTVIFSIEQLAKHCIIALPRLGGAFINSFGQRSVTYNVDEISSYIVTAQLSPGLPAKLDDYWKEAREKVIPAEMTNAEIIRLIAGEVEPAELAPASAATLQVPTPDEDLGDAKMWKTAREIPWVNEYFDLSKWMWVALEKKLAAASIELGYSIHKIKSDCFRKINAYHIVVIDCLWSRIDQDPKMMRKWRKDAHVIKPGSPASEVLAEMVFRTGWTLRQATRSFEALLEQGETYQEALDTLHNTIHGLN